MAMGALEILIDLHYQCGKPNGKPPMVRTRYRVHVC